MFRLSTIITTLLNSRMCTRCQTSRQCGGGAVCSHDADEQYENHTSNEKLDVLWDLAQSNTLTAVPGHPLDIFRTSLGVTVHRKRDILPAGRGKVFHPVGIVCKIHLDIKEHSPFSGVLQVRSHFAIFSVYCHDTFTGISCDIRS